jgi:hypothetical protein
MYRFEVKYTGVRNEQSVFLARVMLLHPYRAFKIEDECNLSTGSDVKIRLRIGMMMKVDKNRPLTF